MGFPVRGGRRPSVAMPTSRRDGPEAFSASSASLPMNSVSNATTQPRPACNGVMSGPSSWPCSGRPASRRSVSRAPSPAGVAPASATACHNMAASPDGIEISSPASPVYPVPATVHSAPFQTISSTLKRPTVPKLGHTTAATFFAAGPCTAMTARCVVMSSPPSVLRTDAVFDAFGMTSITPLWCHHTMMSSSTPPSVSNKWVYCARPGSILPRSLVNVFWTRSAASPSESRTVPR